MSNNIRVTQTLDDHQVLAELLRQQKEMGKVIDKWYQMAQAASKAGQKTDRTTAKSVKQLRDFAVGLTGISSAAAAILMVVDQIRREYDNLIEKQRKNKQTNVPYEDAMSHAQFKVQGLMSGSELRSVTREYAIKSRNQLSEKAIAQIIAAAISARGVRSKEDLRDALDTALAVSRISPHMETEDAAMVGAGAASFSARYGVRPEQGIGFLMKVGQKSNILGLDSLVNNMVPAIGAMTELGFDLPSAGAFVSALSQGMDDPSGETTRTAAINFATSLRERFRDKSGKVDVEAAMDALRSDPDLRRKFFEGGIVNQGKTWGAAPIGKGRAEPTLESILTPGTTYFNQFEGFKPQIGSFRGAEKVYAGYLADLQANTPVTQTDRAFQNTIAQTHVDTPEQAISSILRDRTLELYQALGYTDAEQRASSVMRDIKSGGTQKLGQVADTFEQRAEKLMEPQYVSTPNAASLRMGMDAPTTIVEPSPEQQRDAKALMHLAGLLREINGTLSLMHESQKTPQVGARQPVRPASAGLGRK